MMATSKADEFTGRMTALRERASLAGRRFWMAQSNPPETKNPATGRAIHK